ncbi:MAG: valine--tRNA ligase [Candidatus Saccharimonadales bacterium]
MRLPKNYEPDQYEEDIYRLWEESGAFKPKEGGKQAYCIVMPPPNANAGLHIGYALTNALEDISARYNRMQGRPTLLLPGADHAGFETQVVYEKKLASEGKSRFDFTRDELYKQIWDFVQDNKGLFESQIRAMGASCDWSEYTFTLDDKIIKSAYSTFKKMWNEGLIYRGERLVNYCTFHGTGFADIEVAHEDATTPLYYMKYGPFELATTRPETKFGDTAIAVHPDDKRYKQYVGKVIEVEGVNGLFEIQVVADEMVDPEFGTGVVKITPAHDFNDWEVAKRHNLPAIKVIDNDGRLNDKTGRFSGLSVEEARKEVVKALEEKGLLTRVDKDYKNRIGKCYKCGTIIEPMLMKQWFINMKPLAKAAINELKAGKIKFYPESKKDQLIKYLEGLRDWNISRQIAWGIPIPAFVNVEDENDWIFDESVGDLTIVRNGREYRRDPDVFDTWFSSSSWPYATLKYPDNNQLKQFYPNGLMETGGEILYPWVSRMIMLGLYVTGNVPFKEVYIHGYVMAEDGSKMSKSVGNVVDPLPIIKEYGSDALRMGIVSGRSPATNTGYDGRRVVEARNFCNKLWNIARFVEGKVKTSGAGQSPKPSTPAEHWVLSRLDQAKSKLKHQLERYEFSEAHETVYHLIWDDVADWYIEAGKDKVNPKMLDYVLEFSLKLVHPFAPFVTETIWQTLYPKTNTMLINQTWPDSVDYDPVQAAVFEKLKSIITEVRHIKTVLNVSGGSLVHADSALIEENQKLITRLAGLEQVKKLKDGQGIALTQTDENCSLDLGEENAGKLAANLKEKENKLSESIKTLKDRLDNKNYLAKAPAKLVSETKTQLESTELELEKIQKLIKDYS